MTPNLHHYFENKTLIIDTMEPQKSFKINNNIITKLTTRKINKFVKLLPLNVHYHNPNNKQLKKNIDIITKIKPINKKMILIINNMTNMCTPKLHKTHEHFKNKTNTTKYHMHKLTMYNQTNPHIIHYIPTIYDTYQNNTHKTYIIIMEQLNNMILKNNTNNISN